MDHLLFQIQTLIDNAKRDYQNRIWVRYDLYCSQFNKMLLNASSHFTVRSLTSIEDLSSDYTYKRENKYEAYDMLAERIKLKEVIDKASLLFEQVNNFLNSQDTIPSSTPETTHSTTLSPIELVCNHFCSVVRSLRRRIDEGPILDVETDGDILYIMKALFRLYFDSIFEENWTNCDEYDFSALLIPRENTALIVKKTMRNTSEQLLINHFKQSIEHFNKTQDFNHIFYFIYDPELRIADPNRLEKQLSFENTGSLHVKILIRPSS